MRTESVLNKVFEEVRSGLVSSVVAEAALFPLDTVKLRQQVHGGSAASVLKGILRDRGFVGLYQGLAGRLIQTITSNVGFFIWQTLLVQMALRRPGCDASQQLGTVVSLLVNMFAQQINRVLTTPIDVVANVNQADPRSKGFVHTFVKLAKTGGVAVLWRGLWVSLLLSLNPALMFTLVGKLTTLVAKLRRTTRKLDASDIFWISGISKTVATLLTYPLIRAKALMQTTDSAGGLWVTLASAYTSDGVVGLYRGVWIMSYKTVLFNSLMMGLKHKVAILWDRICGDAAEDQRESAPMRMDSGFQTPVREKVSVIHGDETPWDAAARGALVIYVDGSWSFLHAAQEHVLKEASRRGDYLLVGVHSDSCHKSMVGTWPTECYEARLERLREHPLITSVLTSAPWYVGEDMVHELGIKKVISGTVTKITDCSTPVLPIDNKHHPEHSARTNGLHIRKDPYEVCKRMGIYEEVQSLNTSTEHDVWMKTVTRVLFSNVDASIDWRILVADGARAPWAANPGYKP